MSGTVHYKGILKEIKPRKTKSLEEIAKDILNERGMEMAEYYTTYLECLNEELYDNYILLNERLYEIVEKEEFDDDVFQANENKDGTISFQVKYNNGGCGFSEAIEQAFKDNKIK